MRLDFALIYDRQSFHRHSKLVFGFPDFYGENMHAWIDCLRSARHPDDRLSRLNIASGKVLGLHLSGFSEFSKANSKLAFSILYCIGFINRYCLKVDGEALIIYHLD